MKHFLAVGPKQRLALGTRVWIDFLNNTIQKSNAIESMMAEFKNAESDPDNAKSNNVNCVVSAFKIQKLLDGLLRETLIKSCFCTFREYLHIATKHDRTLRCLKDFDPHVIHINEIPQDLRDVHLEMLKRVN